MPLRTTCLLLLLALGLPVHAEDAAYRYYVDIGAASIEALDALFMELEADLGNPSDTPIVVVLHGDEAGAFLRSNYAAHKDLVNAAALLDAHGLVDVKMCATWMRNNAITERDIPPFIETVPYGPGEVNRLRDAGFVPMPKVRL